MFIVKRIVIALVSIVVLLVAVAYILPNKIHVERSIDIQASQQTVFEQVNDLRAWTEWSPWHAMEPTASYEYSGPDTGEGSVSAWQGEVIGTGKQTITVSQPPSRIETSLDFGPMGTATSEWTFEESDSGTRVTWGFDTEMGLNPIARYIGLTMDSQIGADYEKGLNTLKAICEKSSMPEPGGDQDQDDAAGDQEAPS